MFEKPTPDPIAYEDIMSDLTELRQRTAAWWRDDADPATGATVSTCTFRLPGRFVEQPIEDVMNELPVNARRRGVAAVKKHTAAFTLKIDNDHNLIPQQSQAVEVSRTRRLGSGLAIKACVEYEVDNIFGNPQIHCRGGWQNVHPSQLDKLEKYSQRRDTSEAMTWVGTGAYMFRKNSLRIPVIDDQEQLGALHRIISGLRRHHAIPPSWEDTGNDTYYGWGWGYPL